MKNFVSIAMLLAFVVGLSSSAEAFSLRFGPRVGLYNEQFQGPCFRSQNKGLEALFTINTGPDWDCNHGWNGWSPPAPLVGGGCPSCNSGVANYYGGGYGGGYYGW